MKYATNRSTQANNIKTLLFDDDKRSDNKDLRNVVMGHYRADYEHPVMNSKNASVWGMIFEIVVSYTFASYYILYCM